MNALYDLTDGAPVSAALLMTIVIASAIALRAPALLERFLLRPYDVARGQRLETLVTSAFLHADLAHLLFNAFTFWAFAFPLERTLGPLMFVALYAVGIAVSAIDSVLRRRNDPNYRTLGASGAILAVLFASICYHPQQSMIVFPIPLPIPAPLFAVAYLAYTWQAARRGHGRVNHDAHLAGAIAGVLFVALTDFDTLRRAVNVLWGD